MSRLQNVRDQGCPARGIGSSEHLQVGLVMLNRSGANVANCEPAITACCAPYPILASVAHASRASTQVPGEYWRTKQKRSLQGVDMRWRIQPTLESLQGSSGTRLFERHPKLGCDILGLSLLAGAEDDSQLAR